MIENVTPPQSPDDGVALPSTMCSSAVFVRDDLLEFTDIGRELAKADSASRQFFLCWKCR
jgi:hypothetical protein